VATWVPRVARTAASFIGRSRGGVPLGDKRTTFRDGRAIGELPTGGRVARGTRRGRGRRARGRGPEGYTTAGTDQDRTEGTMTERWMAAWEIAERV